MKQFLICDSVDHADAVDGLVLDNLMSAERARGSRWSGVFTDGVRYGILWAPEVSEVFGAPKSPESPDGDPSLQIATEVIDQDGVSNWQPVPPPAPAP